MKESNGRYEIHVLKAESHYPRKEQEFLCGFPPLVVFGETLFERGDSAYIVFGRSGHCFTKALPISRKGLIIGRLGRLCAMPPGLFEK